MTEPSDGFLEWLDSFPDSVRALPLAKLLSQLLSSEPCSTDEVVALTGLSYHELTEHCGYLLRSCSRCGSPRWPWELQCIRPYGRCPDCCGQYLYSACSACTAEALVELAKWQACKENKRRKVAEKERLEREYSLRLKAQKKLARQPKPSLVSHSWDCQLGSEPPSV